jgi:hypothetical protein
MTQLGLAIPTENGGAIVAAYSKVTITGTTFD